MDSRTALKRDTTLRFDNGYEYTITDELARGGSSIVYNAFYVDNLGEKKTVRIKECYPFKCDLKRGSGGELLIPSSEEERFAETKEKTLRAYRHGNGFFHTDGLTNLTANTYNIFEANNTLYIVSAYCHVFYDSKDRCNAVEFFEKVELIYKNMNLFDLRLDDLQSVFPDMKEEYGSYISKKYSIGIVFSGNKVESILVGCEGYYC